MSNILQKTKVELGLIIIVIILSGTSSSLLIFGPLDIISYTTYRDIVIIPSVIVIFAIGILTRSKYPQYKKIGIGNSCITINPTKVTFWNNS